MFWKKNKDEKNGYSDTISMEMPGDLLNQVRELERRVHMLECSHEDTELRKTLRHPLYYGWSVCAGCGKIIEQFKTEKEFLEAKCSFAKKAADVVCQELKALDTE